MNNKKYGMPPPMNRTEMEHNLNLVIEDFNNYSLDVTKNKHKLV